MSSFREFLLQELSGSSGWGGYNPFSRTASYGFGEIDPISAPFQNQVPPGGYQSFGQWAQQKAQRTRATRNFDLLKFVEALGVNSDRARQTINMFSTMDQIKNVNTRWKGAQPGYATGTAGTAGATGPAGGPTAGPAGGPAAGGAAGAAAAGMGPAGAAGATASAGAGATQQTPQGQQGQQQAPGQGNEHKINGQILTFDGMGEYLRQLWNRTNAVTMTLGAPGTTPAGDNPERIEGAHFEGQGPHDDGTGPNVNPLILRNVDKRVFIGEASGGPQSGSWEIGLAIYAIEPRDQQVHAQFMASYDPNQATKDLSKDSEQKFDIFREKVNAAIQLFNKWNYTFQKGLASTEMLGGMADKAWQTMAGGTKHGIGLNHSLDAGN